MLQLEIAFLDHPKRSRCNAFDLIEMRVVCRDKNIKSSMIDVDVGDQRTTISLSRASHNLLNPTEEKVIWLTQANYANDNHNKNDNANANANDNANASDNATSNDNGFPGHPPVSCFSLDSPRP
jgi:hypothetical protein